LNGSTAAPADTAPSAGVGSLQRAAFAGMFLFGIAAALLGATLPLLSERLGLGLGRVGTLFLVMNAGMLASSFGLGALQDRYGMKPPLVAGSLGIGAALVLVATAGSYGQLLVAVLLLGVAGAALNGASNALVADLHDAPASKTAALNRVGVFFGVGALLVPFAIGLLLRAAGLRSILLGAALLCLAVATFDSLPAYPPPKQAGGLRAGETARFARDPLVLLLGALLFFQSGNEFIVGGYTTTLLTREIGAGVQAASYALAGYWAALMATRAWLGRGRAPIDGAWLVVASALVSAAGGPPGRCVAPVAGDRRRRAPRGGPRRDLPGRPCRRRGPFPGALRHGVRPPVHDGPRRRHDAAVAHRSGGRAPRVARGVRPGRSSVRGRRGAPGRRGQSWIRRPRERRAPVRRATAHAKTADRTRPTPVVAPSAS